MSSSSNSIFTVWEAPGSSFLVFSNATRFLDAFSMPPSVYGGL